MELLIYYCNLSRAAVCYQLIKPNDISEEYRHTVKLLGDGLHCSYFVRDQVVVCLIMFHLFSLHISHQSRRQKSVKSFFNKLVKMH